MDIHSCSESWFIIARRIFLLFSRTVPPMLSQQLVGFMDDLACFWIPHDFRVLIVTAILAFLPVHPLLSTIRPTRF